MTETCRLRQGEGYEVCADEVRVERCGKSAPECRRLHCYVNLIRCNAYWYALPQHRSGGQRRNGGLNCEATCRLDKLSHTTELGL